MLMRELRHSLSTGMSRYVTLGELNSSPYGSRIRARAATYVTSKVQTDSATGDLSLAVLSAAEAGRPGDLDLLSQQLPQTRWLKYAAVASLKNRDAEDAAEKLLLLLSVGDQLDTQDAIELLALCVIEHGRPISVVPRIVHALVTLTAYRARVPISSLYDAVTALGHDKSKSPVESIVFPILLDLQYKLGKKVSEGARTSACEDFLLVCGVERPSELETISVDIDPAQMIYLLRHVCVPTILDSSVAYGGTRDIEDERIKICRRLITLDEENRQAYVDEIASITRRQLIMRDMSDIERSKIHVDTEGVRNLVYAEGQDMYKRFRSLPAVDHDAVRQLVAKVVSERLQSFDGRHLEIILPPTQRTQAFREFYALVRDRFVSSNEYGLDVYLSVGIRHSTLEKHLRSVFEAQRLITRKDQQSHYLPNDYWRTEFSYDIDEEQHARAQAILAEFSLNVDLLIATLKNNWIQVKTEDKNRDGLFDFSISIQALGSLLTQAMEVSTFEEAVELVLTQLWDTTDRCLVAIRARLHDDLLPKFERLLQNLSQSILAATGPLRPALSSAIAQSRTDIQSQIAHTSEWFARSSALTMADYQFEHAVDIAIEMVKRCYPARPLNLERKFVIDRQLRGDSLVGVVTVLYTALDNVLERSQVVDRAPTVSISMSATDTALDLVIANDVSRDPLKLHTEQELLAAIIQDAGLSKASDKVRREGGSGILKISRAIRIDLKGTPKLSAVLTATKFELHVSIEGGRVGK